MHFDLDWNAISTKCVNNMFIMNVLCIIKNFICSINKNLETLAFNLS